MVSNRVHWEGLDPQTYEDMVAVLISRLNPQAQRIDGSGGDGGRDVQILTDEGPVFFELKSFKGRLNPSRRQQVKRSLQRAARQDPVRWSLVVPIDPTPGERVWFRGLCEEYPFPLRWLGKTWLDGELSQKPEIVRYYAHGERFTFEEICDLLTGIGATPPPGQEGIVRAAAEHAGGILRKLNEADPHYEFGFDLKADGHVNVTISPRYPGAQRDRPLARVKFGFPDTAEGENARRALQESIDFGIPTVILPEFITEMSLDAPTGLRTDLEGYQLHVGSPAPHIVNEVTMVLKAVDQRGTALAQLSLTAAEASIGTRGVRMLLRDKSGAFTASATFDVSSSKLKMDWSFSLPQEFSPLELLPAAKFGAAVERGALVVIGFKGDTIGPEDPAPFPAAGTGDAIRSATLLEQFTNVQMKTGIFFDVDNTLTMEEAEAIKTASRLLNGEELTGTWDQMTINVVPDGLENFQAALQGRTIHHVRLTADLSIEIRGQIIPIGRVVRVLESARVQDWDIPQDGAISGTTRVFLVPADNNIVTTSLGTEDE